MPDYLSLKSNAMSRSKAFLVLKASAGSGKTYALVKNYLQLCLAQKSASYYRHILAITFTNAAAAEMKERVIGWLHHLAVSKPAELENDHRALDLTSALDIPIHELQARAASVLSHMVHHYDLLAITTIDSFTHRIVRSFARELGMDYDFSVELDTNAFLTRLVDRVMEMAGEDPLLTRYLADFVKSRLDEGGNWRIQRELHAFSKTLVEERSVLPLRSLERVSPDQIQQAARQLNHTRRELSEELQQRAKQILELISGADLASEDFSGGASRSPVRTIALWAGGEWKDATKTLRQMAASESPWLPAKAASDKKNAMDVIQSQLCELTASLIEWIDEHETILGQLNHLSRDLYSLGLITALNHLAEEIRNEENILLIADFQRRINEVISDSPAPFIYERIGERFRHVLFDEFQDTSELQWENFIPLIENNLGSANINLVVGDGKQAIYRWRNGKVEQFVNLPALPASQSIPWRQELFNDSFEEQFLDTNRRSASSIVKFNNEMYGLLARTPGMIADVYRHHEQHPFRKREGYVKCTFAGGGRKEVLGPVVLNEVENAIRECLEDGYTPGDIAILTRKGKQESGMIAEWLTGKGYQVITKESFRLAQSPLIQWLFHWFAWCSEPTAKVNRVEVVVKFRPAFPHLSIPDESEYLEPLESRRARTEDFLDAVIPSYQEVFATAMSAFEMVLRILNLTATSRDVYIEFLLDQLVALDRRKDMPVHEIVKWWEEARGKLYIESSGKANAIRLMTIHKAKGLQFPVVIYPRFRSKEMPSTVWVEPGELLPDVPAALVTALAGTEKNARLFPEIKHEAEANRLDDINVAYVATTRAEERLYMILTQPASAQSWDNVWIDHLGLSEANTEQAFGIRELKSSDSPSYSEAGRVLKSSVPSVGSPSLRLRPDVDPTRHAGENPRWVGQLVHACLADWVPGSSIHEAVQRVCARDGASDTALISEIVDKMSAVLNHPEWSFLFESGEKALTEQEIILPDGSSLRPDRIVKRSNGYLVVDFKTGAPRKEHHRQIRSYMNRISEVTNAPCDGYILYTSEMRLETAAMS